MSYTIQYQLKGRENAQSVIRLEKLPNKTKHLAKIIQQVNHGKRDRLPCGLISCTSCPLCGKHYPKLKAFACVELPMDMRPKSFKIIKE